MNAPIDHKLLIPKHHPSWPPYKEKQLASMVKKGMSSGLIAGELKTTRSAIVSKCKKLGLKLDSTLTLNRILWTPELVSDAVRLRNEGFTHEQIGMKLGFSEAAVERRLYKARYREGRAVATYRSAGPGLKNGEAKPPVVYSVKETVDLAGLDCKRTPFTDLRLRSCRFPLWPHKDHPTIAEAVFCGNPTEVGRSYCARCEAIVTRPRVAA